MKHKIISKIASVYRSYWLNPENNDKYLENILHITSLSGIFITGLQN